MEETLDKITNRLKILESFYLKQKQAAHDIRSPICALKVILNEIKIPNKYGRLLNLSLERIEEIVKDIINFEGKNLYETFFKKTKKPFCNILEDIILEKKLEWKFSNVQLSLAIEKNTYNKFTNADSSEIKRALSNILNNSYEAISLNGLIKVELLLKNNWLILKIIDNGRGIPKGFQYKLCERGVSYGKKDGHGLGLAYAKDIINKYGGKLELINNQENGTTVIILLEAFDYL